MPSMATLARYEMFMRVRLFSTVVSQMLHSTTPMSRKM